MGNTQEYGLSGVWYIKDSCQKDQGVLLATWWDPQLFATTYTAQRYDAGVNILALSIASFA